jgi:uncharacterized membrane protein
MEGDEMTLGPVQIVVFGFDKPDFKGEALAELDRLREADVVRLIDVLVVYKHEDGTIEKLQHSDMTRDELQDFGATVGALIGFGYDGEEGAMEGAELGAEAMGEGDPLDNANAWYVEDAIPPNSAAAIALLEHRWAIGLRGAIARAGGAALADTWLHPADLIAVGLLAAEEESSEQEAAKT